jgi:uncharacterized protein
MIRAAQPKGGLGQQARRGGPEQKSAANGNHQAQLLLSLMDARGQGVPQDDKEGLAWLAKAGEGAPPEKQRAMRMLYFQTRSSYDGGRQLSTVELAARALPGLQQMADQGDPNAKCALLQMYETGQAQPNDRPRAGT